MREIEIRASRPYRVLIGGGVLNRAGELAAPLFQGRQALIAAGETAHALFGEALKHSLEAAGFRVSVCVYPSGEEAKTPETMMKIVQALSAGGFSRADALFALGGGVTGDMAGLAAALYQRGMGCVLLPTTLLAAADACVGGKTAVDLPAGKNQMGVFSQPRLALCDTDSFRSLPAERVAEGWAEIVKTAFLRGGELWELVSGEAPGERLEEIIAACLRYKGELVAADEFDEGERQLLNFGHTVGHAVERCSGWRWHHGQAVAAGMAIITRACCRRGLCGAETLRRLEETLDRFGLPKSCPYAAPELLEAARADKKRRGERVTLVLPRAIGECERRDCGWEELGELIALGL